jgi:tRNA (adenine57-N1/adenine58-N1)-methyltransferase catalytic subunit
MKRTVEDGRFVAPGSREPFGEGETVVLRDGRGRRSLIVLRVGATWHSHSGALEHDALIGRPEGTAVATPKGVEILALRPTREDFILKMKRGAQVVYPKDQAMIVSLADIRPGMHVLEAGAGSGALTLALLDAVGPEGQVTSCEHREDHADIARSNVARFHGGAPSQWDLIVADALDVLSTRQVDRIVLDLLEPWNLVDAAAESLAPGGIIVTYVPSVPQMMRVSEALAASGRFTDIASLETLVRGWDIEGLAVRPAHRMVAHTAFLTRARRVPSRDEGGPLPPRRRRQQTAGVAWIDAPTEDASDPSGTLEPLQALEGLG